METMSSQSFLNKFRIYFPICFNAFERIQRNILTLTGSGLR